METSNSVAVIVGKYKISLVLAMLYYCYRFSEFFEAPLFPSNGGVLPHIYMVIRMTLIQPLRRECLHLNAFDLSYQYHILISQHKMGLLTYSQSSQIQ